MCLVVLGRHMERLRFLEVLLGDRAALTPSEIAYQRMLAGDPIGATEQAQAQAFLKGRALVDYYEEILIGALRPSARACRRSVLMSASSSAMR
jgi:hypothetical protein